MSESHDCVLHHPRPRRGLALSTLGVLILAMVMTFTLSLVVLRVPAEATLIFTGVVCLAAVRARHGLLAASRRPTRRDAGPSA